MIWRPRNMSADAGKQGANFEGETSAAFLAALSIPYGDHLQLAIAAADDIRNHLRDYADATDTPAWEVVEAADLLDSVADLLGNVVEP